MLSGIYYGAMYGGSTTSILVNIPGESASVITCIDGYQMALKGRAGPALGISAFGSFFAGTVSLMALMLVAPRLQKWHLSSVPRIFFPWASRFDNTYLPLFRTHVQGIADGWCWSFPWNHWAR